MSFPRLALIALGLALLTGACGAPLAVTAASYGADGVSLVETGKSTSDHFLSLVSRKDCALWRVLRKRKICKDRPDGHDPYKVNYDEANRMPSEDGVSYAPPLHPAADAPATSWTAEAYKPARTVEPVQTAAAPPAEPEPAPVIAAAEPPPPPVVTPKAPSASKSAKKKPKAHAKAVRKPAPNQVASAP